MKTKLLVVVCMVVALLTGCASSTMTSRKTLTDGSVIEYTVKISSVGQDLKGSDLSATLNPEGKTTVKAGSIDNAASQITADVAQSMVEIVKMLLPYIAPVPIVIPIAP